jgi:hypothetical protein
LSSFFSHLLSSTVSIVAIVLKIIKELLLWVIFLFYGAVHLVTAKSEQWLCCTATRQIAMVETSILSDDCFPRENGQISSATG